MSDSPLFAMSSLARPPDIVLRSANSNDAALLAHMGRKTFCDNFAHLYTEDNLEPFLQAHYGETIQRAELLHPDIRYCIAFEGEQAVGFVKFGPCKLPIENPPQPAFELHRLYVSTEHQSKKIGQRLMEWTLETARQMRASSLFLGVWEENSGAQRFYGRFGFQKVGEYFFQVGNHYDHEYIFQWMPESLSGH